MTKLTTKMITAAHGVTLKHGFLLSAEILEEIYQSMSALAHQSLHVVYTHKDDPQGVMFYTHVGDEIPPWAVNIKVIPV